MGNSNTSSQMLEKKKQLETENMEWHKAKNLKKAQKILFKMKIYNNNPNFSNFDKILSIYDSSKQMKSKYIKIPDDSIKSDFFSSKENTYGEKDSIKTIEESKFINIESDSQENQFVKHVKNLEKLNSLLCSNTDFELIFKLPNYFRVILVENNYIFKSQNLDEFQKIKEKIINKFDSDTDFTYFYKTFFNFLEENLENIYFKPTINSRGEKIFSLEKSIFYSNINFDNLTHSLVEYNIINHLLNAKQKITDYFFFKDYLFSKSTKLENIFYNTFEKSLEKPDFFILNERFKKSIEKSDYYLASGLRERLKDDLQRRNNKKNPGFCKENITYEENLFKKNDQLFNNKFKEQKSSTNSKRFNFDDLNLLQKFKFYLLKSITNFFLFEMKITERNDFLIDLSHAFILLKSETFKKYFLEKSISRPNNESDIIPFEIKENFSFLVFLKNYFYKKFEDNYFDFSNESNAMKENNLESFKFSMKLQNYYMLFGEFKECLLLLEENEENLNKIDIKLYKNLKEEIETQIKLEKIINSDSLSFSNLSLSDNKEVVNVGNINSNSISNNNNVNANNFNNSNINNNNNNSNNNNNNNDINNDNNNTNNNNNQNNNNNINPPNPLDPPVGANIAVVQENNNIMHKILSIDGGGIKGIFALYNLRVIEVSLNKPIYDLFDFFTGTSIGGLICLCFAYKIYNAENLYREMVGVFKDNIFVDSFFSPLHFLFNFKYSIENLEEILQNKLVDINNNNHQLRFNSNSKNFLVTTCRQDQQLNKLVPYCYGKFGNISGFYRINCESIGSNTIRFIKETYTNWQETEIWKIVRATTAAYPYFKNIAIGDYSLVDGGYQFNNPALLALEFIKNHMLQENANQQVVDRFYSGVYLLSFGLDDMHRANSPNLIWRENENILDYIFNEAHSCIALESKIIIIFYWKNEILRIMKKISNFCKEKLKKLLGNNYIRIEPNYNDTDVKLDSISYTDILNLLNYSENTLTNLGILPNNPYNHVNIEDINTIIRNLYILNNLQNYQNSLNRNHVSRKLTRYQKFPLSFYRISRILNDIENVEESEQRILRMNELSQILRSFDFRQNIPLYQNMTKEDANICPPSSLFKNKDLTYALAIGHYQTIKLLANSDNIQTFTDNWNYSSFHVSIMNDEIVSFYSILNEYFDIKITNRAYNAHHIPNWLNNINNWNRNSNIIDENDITIEEFLDAGNFLDDHVRTNLENNLRFLRNELQNKKCGVFYSITGILGSNSIDLVDSSSGNNISCFLRDINRNLIDNGMDPIFELNLVN